jgi:hypothetical protein
MTEVDNDVRETYEALTELIENDDLLADLCRTAEAALDQTQVAGNKVRLSYIVARWRPLHIKAFRVQVVWRYQTEMARLARLDQTCVFTPVGSWARAPMLFKWFVSPDWVRFRGSAKGVQAHRFGSSNQVCASRAGNASNRSASSCHSHRVPDRCISKSSM